MLQNRKVDGTRSIVKALYCLQCLICSCGKCTTVAGQGSYNYFGVVIISHNLCMHRASWIANRWIVHRELGQQLGQCLQLNAALDFS